MKARVIVCTRLVIVAAALALLAIPVAAKPALQAYGGQQPAGGQAAQATDAEIQDAKKVQSAADPAAALAAAADFVKKHPKSGITNQVAGIVMQKIGSLPDANQIITFSESFQTTFKGPEYDDIIMPVLIQAYVKADRLDDAFQKTDAFLQKHPDDLPTLTQMCLVGADQIKHKNGKYVAQALKYGASAVAIIESDKKPASLSDADWTQYKTKYLGQIYQSMGLMSLATGNEADALAKLQKSLAANPNDPFTYVLLGTIADTHYEKLASQYKGMVPGADQDAMLKKALEQMDQVIDYFAHGVALSDGSAPYKQLHDQVLTQLELLYKYRHKGTDGLQQLIDKYKKPANG